MRVRIRGRARARLTLALTKIAGALEAKAGAADGLRELLLQHNSIGDRDGLGLGLG